MLPMPRIFFIHVAVTVIDGLHLTSWRPCWRYNTKEYFISSIVGSSRRGWLHCVPHPERLIANQEYGLHVIGYQQSDYQGVIG